MKSVVVIVAVLTCAFAAPRPDNRITGGTNAIRNQFPYQVSLQWGILGIYRHICGGSVVSPRVILTAGHCITEIPSFGSLRIKAGLLNLDDTISAVQTVSVSSAIVHHNYQGGVGPNDVALLRLESSLSYTDAVQPIALPSVGSVATGNASLTGWGSVSLTGNQIMPNALQTATLPLLSLEECGSALSALLGSSEPLADTNICSGPLSGGLSACSGDSGGPLAQDGKVIGVVSWGIMPCGTVGAPSVYTQVSSFVGWINQNL